MLTRYFKIFFASCDLENEVNVTKFASPSDIFICASLAQIHRPFRRYDADKALFDTLGPHVTLHKGSRSPKPFQFLYLTYISV